MGTQLVVCGFGGPCSGKGARAVVEGGQAWMTGPWALASALPLHYPVVLRSYFSGSQRLFL